MLMPSENNLVIEVTRRYYNSNDSAKKCKSCTVTKCKYWLVNNAVTEANDMQFLLHEEGLLVRSQRKGTKSVTKLIR